MRSSKRRSDKAGRIGTVEVEHVLETPSHLTPEASAHSLQLQKGRSNVIGPAKCVRVGSSLPYTSQGIRAARKTSTKKIELITKGE